MQAKAVIPMDMMVPGEAPAIIRVPLVVKAASQAQMRHMVQVVVLVELAAAVAAADRVHKTPLQEAMEAPEVVEAVAVDTAGLALGGLAVRAEKGGMGW